MAKEVKLVSGNKLEITMAPFAEARALYQSILSEMKGLSLDPKAEVDVNLFKDMFCTLLASKPIEAALFECMKRSTYNGMKISLDTFEPVEAREDYLDVCIEVAKENIAPFAKRLYAEYSHLFGSLTSVLK